MPITIVNGPPTGLGPGQTIVVTSDVIGPIPPGSDLTIRLFPVGGEEPCYQLSVPWAQFTQQVKLAVQEAGQTSFVSLPNEADITAVMEIRSQAGLFDQGTQTGFKWRPTSQIVQQLQELSTGGGGALTPEQSLQLSETHASTFPSISMDALTLTEISQGPQGGVVASQLLTWIMGVIVRIAEVPPEFRVNTADGDYWSKSLAVVRIYRGSDLWKRVPVHTSSKIITFIDEGLTSAVAAVLPIQWLLQISVQVSFAEGVTGQVFLMHQG